MGKAKKSKSTRTNQEERNAPLADQILGEQSVRSTGRKKHKKQNDQDEEVNMDVVNSNQSNNLKFGFILSRGVVPMETVSVLVRIESVSLCLYTDVPLPYKHRDTDSIGTVNVYIRGTSASNPSKPMLKLSKKNETRATLSVALYTRQMHLHGITFTTLK